MHTCIIHKRKKNKNGPMWGRRLLLLFGHTEFTWGHQGVVNSCLFNFQDIFMNVAEPMLTWLSFCCKTNCLHIHRPYMLFKHLSHTDYWPKWLGMIDQGGPLPDTIILIKQHSIEERPSLSKMDTLDISSYVLIHYSQADSRITNTTIGNMVGIS